MQRKKKHFLQLNNNVAIRMNVIVIVIVHKQIQARNHLAIRELDSGASDQLGELNEDLN